MTRIYPPHVFFVCTMGIIGCWFFLPAANVIFFPFTLLGTVPLVLGIWLLIGGSTLFKSLKTNIMPYNKPDRLVTNGPFRFTRNPMYLGFLLILIGAALLLGNLAASGCALTFFLWIQYWNIPFEEALCEQAFGQEYLDYKASVRRWL